jgi:leucyl/phenylalanyl-tRNA--protein transferase
MSDLKITWIDESQPLPRTSRALGPGSAAPGLLAAGGTLTPQRLAGAYRRGIFPWFGPDQPVLWWTPDPRMVLPVAEFIVSHNLRKTLRRFIRAVDCEIRIDHDFSAVIEACAHAPRTDQDGTWIVPEMIDAYRHWHDIGAVHSFETWIGGELVGGLYGISIGRMFFGESMFTRGAEASKIALCALVAFCRANAIALIDCQQQTRHLASFGARAIPRSSFESHLKATVDETPPPRWTYDRSYWALLGLDPPAPSLPGESRGAA